MENDASVDIVVRIAKSVDGSPIFTREYRKCIKLAIILCAISYFLVLL